MADEKTDDRKSLLAAFARVPEKAGSSELVTMTAATPERVIGAQAVAVHRDPHRVLETIKRLGAAAGENWYYRYPVKTKDGGREWIEGPTIKLANDLAREYGNCDIDTRVTDLGDSWLIYARFTDYETGFSMTRPFQQRKGQRSMRTDDARALDIALQIGASKAIRNVIVNSLQSFAEFAFQEAQKSLVEEIGKNLPGSRTRAQQRLAEKHVELARAERIVGRAIKDWAAPDIAQVVAMLRSIEEGMTTVEDTFPPLDEDVSQDVSRETSEPASPPPPAGEAERGALGGPDIAEGVSAPDPAIIAAYEKGKQAREAGRPRKAVPGEFRDSKHTREMLAWLAGYDGSQLPENLTRQPT